MLDQLKAMQLVRKAYGEIKIAGGKIIDVKTLPYFLTN